MIVRLLAILAVLVQPLLPVAMDPACRGCAAAGETAACCDRAPTPDTASCCGEGAVCGSESCAGEGQGTCDGAMACAPAPCDAACIIRLTLCRALCGQSPETQLAQRDRLPESPQRLIPADPRPWLPHLVRPWNDSRRARAGAPAPAISSRARLAAQCCWII